MLEEASLNDCVETASGHNSDASDHRMDASSEVKEDVRLQQVFFLRHGEGVHNATRNYNGCVDPILTERGRAQAAEVRHHQTLKGCDLLVVSPLSRAIETAAIVFGESPQCRVVLSPLHSERWSAKCDEGRAKSQLVDAFPYIAEWEGFQELPEHWTPTGENDRAWRNARLPAFLKFLQEQPETHIVVVGHGAFFEAVLGRHLHNCEIAKVGGA